MWGIVPAAGRGTRIQPLAFSKELLPVGSRSLDHMRRPSAVAEYLIERFVQAGADKICFVIGPGKSDILEYFGGTFDSADLFYAVQPEAVGLCDAIFRAAPLIGNDGCVAVGLPDTIWFPKNALDALPDDRLSFLLFPVDQPELFDAVALDAEGQVLEIRVKQPNPGTRWIWGAFKMPVGVFHELHHLWIARERCDEFIGTLINAWLGRGGCAQGIKAGETYIDVGTLGGYHTAMEVLLHRDAAAELQAGLAAPPPEIFPAPSEISR